ncbi:ribonuclease inhibitor [Dyadobacter sp. CY345]|uniref:c-type cytochrome domain-containing protein n=1 Tax=Dyadobacter sp. CY345 TaxID=2909335 RepID=UPI001F3C9573|nr:c-type cytochrome domain-containing protein [Dyadobacter sp. CY345]MCF2443408.1 ribonuclease inhibitor [Dyadobacter sp. CY345]
MTLTVIVASDFTNFIGRFHPVLVHAPIGFLLIAALLEAGRRMGKISVSESTVTFILFWSAVSATFACFAGYMLSLGGGYDEKLLSDHMWQGIGVAAFAWIAWLLKSEFFQNSKTLLAKFYFPAFCLATILTMTAGHDGGSLTHGEGYLTQYTPEPFRSLAGMDPIKKEISGIQPIADIQQALVYQDIVQPILEMKCVQCHNEKKQKGDLRVDQFVSLQKGGKEGPVFIPGKGAESSMITRCLLPEDDDDHMPPKGKPQLSTDQITLISWWIDQGAPVDKKVSDIKVTEQIKTALAGLGSSGGASKSELPKSAESAIAKLTVSEPSEKDIEALRKAGLLVNRLSQDQNLIEVSAVNAANFGDAQISLLLPLAEQITWLKLGKTKITDAGLKEVSKLKNLTRLHLEHTAVGDAGLANLKSLKYLEYLNLVDTKVSDRGLKNVADNKSVKSVYVWGSAVSDSAIAVVTSKYPGLVITNGLNKELMARFAQKNDTLTSK